MRHWPGNRVIQLPEYKNSGVTNFVRVIGYPEVFGGYTHASLVNRQKIHRIGHDRFLPNLSDSSLPNHPNFRPYAGKDNDGVVK